MASHTVRISVRQASKTLPALLVIMLVAMCLVPSVAWAETTALTNLKSARDAAQQEAEKTQAALSEAEQVLDQVRSELTQPVNDAQANLDAKSEASASADKSLQDAEDALAANAAEIEMAQAAIAAAEADEEAAKAAEAQARARMQAAQRAMNSAQAKCDAAQAEIDAETLETPDEEKQAHADALAAAQAEYDAATDEFSVAAEELTGARNAKYSAQGDRAAAQERLDSAQGKIADLEGAVTDAQDKADTARSEVSDAQAQVAAAQAALDAIVDRPEYKAVEEAKIANDNAQAILDAAQKDVDDYTDLGHNPDVKWDPLPSYVWQGALISWADKDLHLTINGEKLYAHALDKQDDYYVNYENNADVGEATMIVHGRGDYTGELRIPFTIKRVALKAPVGKNLVYNGKVQRGVDSDARFLKYTAEGGTATEAGKYTARVTLVDPDHYCWADGGPTTREVKWSIERCPISFLRVSIQGIGTRRYTGKPIKLPIIVTVDSKKMQEGVDYTLSYSNNTKIGNKATVKITGKRNLTGTVAKTFKISKLANTMKVTPVTKSISFAKVKKKSQTVKGALKIANAKGTVVYVKVASGSDKKLSINKTTGKITVAKGTAKGVHKIKVKVTAKGNSKYVSLSRTVTVSIKVK